MDFLVKTKKIFKLLFRNYVWKIPTREKVVYLTFDDGPTPEITNWVLAELEKYNAKATFFCIGENVKEHPALFKSLSEKKHSVGNHTFNHLNGWKTKTDSYIENSVAAEIVINSIQKPQSLLFRPPYGKIKLSQSRRLRKMGYKIIMWDIISFDFDESTTQEKCLRNVLDNISPGSIIVFHDSAKAFNNLEYVLTKTLAHLNENGYSCKPLL